MILVGQEMHPVSTQFEQTPLSSCGCEGKQVKQLAVSAQVWHPLAPFIQLHSIYTLRRDSRTNVIDEILRKLFCLYDIKVLFNNIIQWKLI